MDCKKTDCELRDKPGGCYGCFLDSLVPKNYAGREQYEFDPTWGQANATEHPKTGVPILDLPRGFSVWKLAKNARLISR